MFLHYLKTAFRNIARFKIQSVIVILSIALGMVFCSLTFMWIRYERSYDSFYRNADDIYLITQKLPLMSGDEYHPATTYPKGPYLADKYPEIEEFARCVYESGYGVLIDGKYATSLTGLTVDENFGSFFDVKVLEGDPILDLAKNEIALTKTQAEKLFEGRTALGDTLHLNYDVVSIKAIIEDPRKPTSLPYDFLKGYDVERYTETNIVSTRLFVRVNKDNLQQSYPELERIKTIYDALGNYLQIPVGAGNGQSYPFDMNEFANSYGFSLLEVFNSLKLMEREGFFALSEAMESPSQLFIKASREDLYRFQVEYAEFDAMIKYLLRNYPGILSDFVKIKEEQISHKMGIDVTQVEQTLKNLEKYNFLTYIQRNGKPQIQYLTERQDTRHFALSDEVYKDRKDDATRRVQAVIDFVNNDSECRSVQLLRYFGEKIKTRCGRCDVCSIRNQMKINDEEYKNISELILDELKKRVVPLYETPSLAKNYLEEKVLETVRWMLDNGIIEQDENGNLKEKGRQWSLF